MWWKCKRNWSRLYRLALVALAVAVALLVLVVGPWPVAASRRSAEGTTSAAVESVEAAARSLDLAPGPCQAGHAIRRIAVKEGLPLAGYAGRQGISSEGVAQDLHVRAVALGNGRTRVLVFGVDLLFVPESLAARVRRELRKRAQLADGQIVFTVTHTHSAPNPSRNRLLGRALGGRGHADFVRQLSSAFVQAGLEAVETMRPAVFGSFWVDASDLVADAENVDATLRGFVIQGLEGGRVVVLNFGARATVLGPGNLRVSGDYPGYVEAALERRSGAMALFQAGAVQGVLPVPPSQRSPDGEFPGLPASDPAAHARARALGEELARRAEQAMEGMESRDQTELAAFGLQVPLPPADARIDRNWRLSPAVPWLAGMRRRAYVQGVRVGDVCLVALPVEFSGALLRELVRDESPSGPRLWICSLAGGYQGVAGAEASDALVPWLEPRDPEYFRGVVEALGKALAGE